MYVGLQHIGEDLVNHSMPLDTAPAGKSRRNDANFKMALAIAGAGMSRVQMALILDQQFGGAECRHEQLADPIRSIRAHGSTSLNGFTATLA